MLSVGYKTDIGRVRKTNQDNLVVDELIGLLVVADGMGGHAGGEIASALTVETVPQVVRQTIEQDAPEIALMQAMRRANERVFAEAQKKPGERGMGTTCVAAIIQHDHAIVGNVGDSRCYLLRAGELRQITEDHSLVQEHVRNGDMTPDEARISRYRNVITRGIGLSPDVKPDIVKLDLEQGDTLLLCSDGLTGMVRDHDIARILATSTSTDHATDRLVAAALQNGGQDNVTVVVARYGAFTPLPVEPSEPDTVAPVPYIPYPEPRRGGGAVTFLIALVMLIIGTALGFVGHDKVAPPKHAVVKPPSPRDYGALFYDPPTLVLKQTVKPPIACDAQGNVYATLSNGHVYRITPKGDFVGDFPPSIAAKKGANIVHWAADPQGFLYVPSTTDKCINKYSPAGTRVAQIGQTLLSAPEAVALNGVGDIYVVDKGLLKVLRSHGPGDKSDGPR